MGTDITGGSYSHSEFGFTFTTGQAEGTQGTETAGEVQGNFNFLNEGTDTIGTFIFTPLQFVFKTVYDASAQSPALKQPDLEGQIGPQPYGSTEQKMIKKFFSSQVNALLQDSGLSPEDAQAVYESIMLGTPLSNGILLSLAAKIKAKATLKTIEEGNLPKSWTIASTNSKDWTPLLIKAYDESQQEDINDYYGQALMDKATTYLEQHAEELTPDQALNLINAIQTGEVSSDIADIYVQISQEARVETQESFGLPSTWFKGTTNVDDWKPINLGIVTPSKVAEARLSDMLDNAELLLSDIKDAAQNLLDGPPPLAQDDPNRLALTDFLKVIGDAIRNLKATLRELQVKDAEKSKESSKAKFDELEDRRVRQNEQAEKAEKLAQKQKQMKTMGLSMKILGPIIAALSTLVGALIAILTLGVATVAAVALIAAGIAVGIAMTAYSIADSVTNCTQKLVKLVKNALKELLPDSPNWVRTLIKVLIVTAIVAVLAVVIAVAMATGGGQGAATNMATQAVAQTVKEAMIETIKQLAIQAMVMAIMSSNALPELVGDILKSSGVSKKDQSIAEAVVMAVQFLVVIVAMTKLSSSGGLANLIGAKTDEAATVAIKETDEVVDQSIKTATQRAQEMIARIKAEASELLDKIKDLPTSIKDNTKEQLQALKDLSGLEIIGMLAQAAPYAVQMGGSITSGVMNLKVRNLLLQVGDIKSAEELLQALIQALEKLLKNIQTGMDNRDGFIQQLQQTFAHIFNAASQNYGKVFQSLQG